MPVITDKWLLAHRASAARQDVPDIVVPGMIVRLGPTGPVFSVRFRRQGKYRRHPLGRYPKLSLYDARELAREVLGRLERGQDPAGGDSFAGLCELYVAQHARRVKRPASAAEDERMINAYLLPAFGRRAAAEIRRRELLDLLHEIAARAPVQANRVRALLSKLFMFALQREIVDTSPVIGIPRLAPEVRRDRVLSPQEVADLWRALDKRHPIIAGVLRFLLLTGQRMSEARLARWEDVDGEWWTIPAAIAKNKRRHRVPLGPQALAILEGATAIALEDNGLIFPSPRRPGRPLSPTALSHVTAAMGEDLGFAFTPHDLRRTAASGMAELGHGAHVGKVLNHTDPSVTAIYDRHHYDAEKRAALEAWGAHVEQIITCAAPRSTEAPPIPANRCSSR